MRTRFQGVGNIIRFNWHFYLAALFLIFFGGVVANALPSPWSWLALIAIGSAAATLIITLVVSHFIYDRSNLYSLDAITDRDDGITVVNVHAGFDEISPRLREKFPHAKLLQWDFYDAEKHTEVSIRRARAAYPPHPDSQSISTRSLPLADDQADLIVVFMSAHEIRNEQERLDFFLELNRIASPSGEVFVTEHLRDWANFFAYTLGFFHFHSKATWLKTFEKARFSVSEQKVTPFVSTFILRRK